MGYFLTISSMDSLFLAIFSTSAMHMSSGYPHKGLMPIVGPPAEGPTPLRLWILRTLLYMRGKALRAIPAPPLAPKNQLSINEWNFLGGEFAMLFDQHLRKYQNCTTLYQMFLHEEWDTSLINLRSHLDIQRRLVKENMVANLVFRVFKTIDDRFVCWRRMATYRSVSNSRTSSCPRNFRQGSKRAHSIQRRQQENDDSSNHYCRNKGLDETNDEKEGVRL